MHRTFVVSSLQFRPSTGTAPPTRVDDLGFSVVQLMRLSGPDAAAATGVRADLKIEDPAALSTLVAHFDQRERLEWTFEFGGGAQSITVSLRWTKCIPAMSMIQVVRNVVMRDLISEAEAPQAETPDDRASASRSSTPPTKRASSPANSTTPSHSDRAEHLWPTVFDERPVVFPKYSDEDHRDPSEV